MKVKQTGYAAAQIIGVGAAAFAYGALTAKTISMVAGGAVLASAFGGGLAIEYAARAITTAYQINFRKALFLQSGVSALYHAALYTSFVALGVLTTPQAATMFLISSLFFSIRQAYIGQKLKADFNQVNPTPLPKSLWHFPMTKEL